MSICVASATRSISVTVNGPSISIETTFDVPGIRVWRLGLQEGETGRAVVYFICSMAKVELTSVSFTSLMSRL
jgi:hypothetical protein